MTLPYPPPWQDMQTLCEHICASESTVNVWVKEGVLPPPRKRRGKLMWKWKEVDDWLTDGGAGKVDSLRDELAAVRERSRHADAPAN